MLKVCILTETYHPVIGGGETQARLLAEGLVATGASVRVLTRRSDAALPRFERQGRVMIHRISPAGRGQLKKWGLLLSVGAMLLRLRREYDVIFVSGFRIVGLSAVLAARLLGKAIVLKADSQGEMSGAFFTAGLSRAGISPSSPPFRLFLRARNAVLRRADAFVAITPDVAAEFADAGIMSARIRMVPNGVDTLRFRPLDPAGRVALRRKLKIDPGAPVAVYTGRLVSYKGLQSLLGVWPAIVRARPDARLLLVGEGGLDIHNCEQELRARVLVEELERSVTFVGGVEDVSPYLQVANVFAFPTENDAFPSSLVEAMACGLAVVTTPVGAIPTIVQDGKNGLLVAPGGAAELKGALLRVLMDSGLAARLGGAACESVLANYSAESITRQ
ncbi:MAG: glycosyltransferase family 1 protein, partial [Lysobacterales bacterium]